MRQAKHPFARQVSHDTVIADRPNSRPRTEGHQTKTIAVQGATTPPKDG